MNADDSENVELGILPPDLQKKLRALALAMDCSEEEVAAKMMQLTVNLINKPDNSDLQNFVQKAQAALKSKKIPF